MESRQSSYKSSSKTLFSIKLATKTLVQDRQIKSRDGVITRKRLKMSTLPNAEELLLKIPSEEVENKQVIEAIKFLKKGDKLKTLTKLHRLFASHQSNADVFLKHDGLQPLHSCFKSFKVDVLHTSAWCVINLTAAASSSSYTSAILGLAPYLLQFLKGSDTVMQELCAWGLANLAGEGMSTADVLHKQGCTYALLDMLEMSDYLAKEERTRSMLFALINLARSSMSCIQCMHENDIYNKLQMLLKEVPVESSLNFEIGWLLSSIYPGCDASTLPIHHLPEVTTLVSERLNHLVEESEPQHCHRICFPFVRCLCNLIGLNPLMSRIILDDLQTFHTINHLLISGADSLKKEVLGLINNCMIDICSRVLLTLQPNILSEIISLCCYKGTELAAQALQVMQAMTRTSSHMDSHLLNQGILSNLLKVLNAIAGQMGSDCSFEELPGKEAFLLQIVISILLDLALSQPELVKKKLECEDLQRLSTTHSFLTRLACNQTLENHLAHQAGQLIPFFGLKS